MNKIVRITVIKCNNTNKTYAIWIALKFFIDHLNVMIMHIIVIINIIDIMPLTGLQKRISLITNAILSIIAKEKNFYIRLKTECFYLSHKFGINMIKQRFALYKGAD